MTDRRINVLDHGLVELVDSMGSDLAIVQAAQSSFGRISEFYGEREEKILRSLMRERHGVPFEHVTLKFRVKMPISVARQFVKHRMSSWSEHSARYSVLELEYYLPDPADVREQVGKPMEYIYQAATPEKAARFLVMLANWSEAGLACYQEALKMGIAREQARYFVPITAYTTITWTMNGRSLLNMLSLRNDAHAQGETREYAGAIEALAEQVIPDTLAAFCQFGRKAP